ncbi:MAG: 6-phosphogluconolactonase [Planctomycetota bacterium]|jgi:6-phosphogluconolactonase/glucosamine-6-phosphate isomerase/deaminase
MQWSDESGEAGEAARPDESGVYRLVSGPADPPPLPGNVAVADTTDELIDRLAADMLVHAENCVRSFGDFHVALSGDAALEPLYARLMYDPAFRRLPWRRTHLWIVSDTCVPEDDPRSLYAPIRETLVDHADIPPDQVHPMSVDERDADVLYEADLREALGWREKGHDRLDYVLLAMNDDGGVGGLHGLGETADRLIVFTGSDPNSLTMTPELMNAARMIGIYAVGPGKAATLRRLASGATIGELPIERIDPIEGELCWYVDGAACR